MAQFDESKIINSLHKDKAEVGKKYYCSDNIGKLKEYVENGNGDALPKLISVNDDIYAPFYNGSRWQFLYPYEEPQKKRMTNRQLAEWLAKHNGEYTNNNEYTDNNHGVLHYYCYFSGEENEEVEDGIVIRSWDSDEWVEPTVDIYERDCK